MGHLKCPNFSQPERSYSNSSSTVELTFLERACFIFCTRQVGASDTVSLHGGLENP